ncbi:uncharacterized protein [Trachinotus anak]|uniref:uncharacterized protein isoform X4 n=1 Tax=Trachinotus anak TaxID=443729 RepID=UPI0039F23E6F
MRRTDCNYHDLEGLQSTSQPLVHKTAGLLFSKITQARIIGKVYTVRLFNRLQTYSSHHKKCEEQYFKFQICQAERERLHTHQLQFEKLIKQILQTKPGGTTVLEEYEETGMLCDSRRRQMVNILAAHMVETEGK